MGGVEVKTVGLANYFANFECERCSQRTLTAEEHESPFYT